MRIIRQKHLCDFSLSFFFQIGRLFPENANLIEKGLPENGNLIEKGLPENANLIEKDLPENANLIEKDTSNDCTAIKFATDFSLRPLCEFFILENKHALEYFGKPSITVVA